MLYLIQMLDEKELTDKEKNKLKGDDEFISKYDDDNRLMINGVSWSKLYDYCILNKLNTSGDIYKTVCEHKT